MSTLYFDSDAPDDVRRHRIYDGDVFVYCAAREHAGVHGVRRAS